MERLTLKTTVGAGIWDGSKSIYPSDIHEHDIQHYPAIQKAFNCLAAYEDTGLEPSEIADLNEANTVLHGAWEEQYAELSAYRALGTVEDFQRLVAAQSLDVQLTKARHYARLLKEGLSSLEMTDSEKLEFVIGFSDMILETEAAEALKEGEGK